MHRDSDWSDLFIHMQNFEIDLRKINATNSSCEITRLMWMAALSIGEYSIYF